eukprot:6490943-Amphidinium_carterae.2
MELQGSELDAAKKASIMQQITTGKASKAAASIMLVLVQRPPDVRSQIQAEIKELRSVVGNKQEGNWLPLPLMDKMQEVLKMVGGAK